MLQRVLLIDDARSIHVLVKARLSSDPVELFSAFDGVEGLTAAAKLQPDLILLDVQMPDPDGFEVCRRLKADPATVGIPIVFLCGASIGAEERIAGLELGAIDYIFKPFDPAELRARVRSSLRTKYLSDLLASKAMIDGLTGLWNRAYLEQRLSQELSLSRRNDTPLSCILMDVDHFKSLNETHGQLCGDEVLQMISGLLLEANRREDVVCRYSGDAFAVLAPNTNSAGCTILAERIRGLISRRPRIERGKAISLTCSFGIASVDHAGNRNAIIEAADNAMHQAKQAGRNRVVVASFAEPIVAAV